MKEDVNITRIAVLENQTQNIMEKLEEFQIDNKEQHQAITIALGKLETKLDVALDKKADKIVVDRIISIWFWLGGIIGARILGYIGLQIVKVIEKL